MHPGCVYVSCSAEMPLKECGKTEVLPQSDKSSSKRRYPSPGPSCPSRRNRSRCMGDVSPRLTAIKKGNATFRDNTCICHRTGFYYPVTITFGRAGYTGSAGHGSIISISAVPSRARMSGTNLLTGSVPRTVTAERGETGVRFEKAPILIFD